MNARQKAKQLKKENERLKKILNPNFQFLDNTYSVKPEILKTKFLMEPYMTEEIIMNNIQRSIGRCLMENGFLDI